jgi:hypothetical protein
MSKNLHNMLKRGAISIALAAITTTSCFAATASKPVSASEPATPGYKKSEIKYSCKTVKNEKFNIKVIKNQNSCWVTVDGQNEVTVDNANTSSPFYSIMKELPSGVANGKDYYTIGLTTCNKI